jgi:hypothetical protein
MTQNIIWGLAAAAGAILLAVFLWLRPKTNSSKEFDLSKFDVGMVEYIEDRLEDRLEEENKQSLDKLVWGILKEEPGWLVLLGILQLVSAGITAWFWMGAGAGAGGKIFAAMFALFNLAVLPYLLGKVKKSVIAALMSMSIIAVSFLASSGLASMATKSQSRDSKTAEKDRLHIVEQITQREAALLAIDKSKSVVTLKSEKAGIEKQREGVFLTQVSYTRNAARRNKSYRGVFDTLAKLTGYCKNPGPVKDAGRLCAQVRELDKQVGALKDRITAMGSAARIRVEIAALKKRRDEKASKATSDPLAPIRSVLPSNISSALSNGWAILLAFVGELIFNGFAYLRMTDANETARRRQRLARQKTFRQLVRDAKAALNPSSAPQGAIDPMLNKLLEKQFDEKSKELDKKAADAEAATAVMRAEMEAKEHEALVALDVKQQQLDRVINATLPQVRASLGPVVTYINDRLETVPGVPVSLTVVINDYERWARRTSQPHIERAELARLLEHAGLSSFSADNVIYLADHRLKAASAVA